MARFDHTLKVKQEALLMVEMGNFLNSFVSAPNILFQLGPNCIIFGTSHHDD